MTTALFLLGMMMPLPGCQAVDTPRVLVCAHADQRFSLVLPADYEAAASHPAVLLLHGAGRNYRTLIDDPQTRAALLRSKSVVILPDGGMSWWRGQDAVLALLDWLSSTLHLDARHIGCGGWSMGGYGSLLMTVDHPGRFAAWAGMIGLVDYPNASYQRASNYPVSEVFGPPDTWPAANPISRVERLRGKAIWFATADQSFDAAMNRHLDQVLDEQHLAHTFEVIPGKHDFAAVSALLPRMLQFFDRVLQ